MKTITTLLFALGLLLAGLLASGQSKSDKMYDTFANKDGITSFSFSKDMIDAIDMDLGDDDEKNVTGDLHRIPKKQLNKNTKTRRHKVKSENIAL
ncbi:protein of unknown function [Draconibacterium orientale]|uniref:Uncharacterized protein n=1 Tax=Draconibacterium orientale TaxID=1168034 RepID=A0A1H9ZMU3_9BACT|nr:DUF4252 domain-containing protein [Draconibacterium orientale]SES82654.1 protein of unknown function [Draconibacterium orientale]